MSEISNIGISSTYAASFRNANSASPTQNTPAGGSDSLGESDPVEFSRLGRLLAGTQEISSLRLAKIQALRAEIEDGNFETPQRIDGTVDRLIQVLGQ